MKPIHVFNYSIRNSTEDTVDVYIDGAIVDAESQQIMKDWFGDDTSVSYKSVRDQITKANPKNVNVHINSPGGIVTDALAIHDYLKELITNGVKVHTVGKGIIASAATFILMADDNCEMSENSFLMIHNMSGMVWGDVNEIENYAVTIRKFNNRARDFYAERTGIRKEDITRMLDAETWMTAGEAKDKGFINQISGQSAFSNSIKDEYWPYQNRAVLNAYNSFTKNHQDMDTKSIVDSITNGVTAAFNTILNKLGIKKEDNADAAAAETEFATALTNSISEGLKPLESLEATITNAVTAAVTAATKDITPENIALTVRNEVATATKDFAKAADLTTLQANIANKLGEAGKEIDVDEDNRDRKVKNKKQFFSVGSFGNE